MKTYLLCYPRSGSHWLAYTINVLTGVAIADFPQRPHLKPEAVEGPIEHTHGHDKEFWDRFDEKNDRLIYIIRNYKECLVRHYKTKGKSLRFKSLKDELRGTCKVSTTKYTTDYIALLALYNRLGSQQKLLVYYEDLITSFETETIRVMAFLDVNNMTSINLSDFLRNYDYHRKNSILYYETNHAPSITRGHHLNFHSNQLEYKVRVKLDKYLQKMFPDLYNRYLERYAEK